MLLGSWGDGHPCGHPALRDQSAASSATTAWQQCHGSSATAALPQQLCHSSLLQAPNPGAVPHPPPHVADWKDFPLFFLSGALFADHQLSPTPVLHNLLARFKKRSCSENVVHSRLPSFRGIWEYKMRKTDFCPVVCFNAVLGLDSSSMKCIPPCPVLSILPWILVFPGGRGLEPLLVPPLHSACAE